MRTQVSRCAVPLVGFSIFLCLGVTAGEVVAADEKILFDFENDADVQAWTNVNINLLPESGAVNPHRRRSGVS